MTCAKCIYYATHFIKYVENFENQTNLLNQSINEFKMDIKKFLLIKID